MTRKEVNMVPTKVLMAAVALTLAVGTAPAMGHHAFAAEFDADSPVKLTGKVTRMEWINPHAWIHMEVVKEDGSTEIWMVESGSPPSLFRRGFTKNSLMPGTEIVVDGFQAKDRSNKCAGRTVTYTNGERLFLGSSGTGAPRDSADPSEPPNR